MLKLRRMPRMLSISVCGMILLSCAKETPSSETSSSIVPPQHEMCLIDKPLTWSFHDTRETILDVKKHNCLGAALCAWGGETEKKLCAIDPALK